MPGTAVEPESVRISDVIEPEVSDMALEIQHEVWRLLFGPGDPALSYFLLHPDLAERRAKRQMGIALAKLLQRRFRDRLTPAGREATVRKILAMTHGIEIFQLGNDKAKARARAHTDNSQEGDNPLVPLTFVLKPPGRVAETNGELDEWSGEVFWELFSEAPALGDVVMFATFEVKER